jgi:hypothetical protein
MMRIVAACKEISIPAQLGHNEGNALRHEARHERHVT